MGRPVLHPDQPFRLSARWMVHPDDGRASQAADEHEASPRTGAGDRALPASQQMQMGEEGVWGPWGLMAPRRGPRQGRDGDGSVSGRAAR